MSVVDQPLECRPLAAPREDRGLLVDPIASEIGDLIRRNLAKRKEGLDAVDIQGRTLGQLASTARDQLLQAAIAYTRSYRDVDTNDDAQRPILLAGHQPDLFHPGVWCKNFALDRIARGHNATAINLIIDSDALHRTSTRVPSGTVANPSISPIRFDSPTPANVPFEEYRIADREQFDSFADRATAAIEPLVANPMIGQFWPLVQKRADVHGLLGLSLAQARHQLEGDWGTNTLELPQSTVCQLESFHHFTAHVLTHLPRFWETYNDAVHEYRHVNKVRSTAHPVPDLAAADSLLEAPFWIWDAENRQRRHLFVGQRGDSLLVTDREGLEFQLSATPDGDLSLAVEQLTALAARGIKIRTRALLTTMFARLVVGDLFIHGIGGAKYDSLTDLLVRRFFGVVPPEYVTLSATLHLRIERETFSADEVRRVERELRDIRFHPETLISTDAIAVDAKLENLVETKRRWVQTTPTFDNVRSRHAAISGANEGLQSHLAGRRETLMAQRDRFASGVRNERILGSREYDFTLYPREILQDFLLDYLPARV